eukprot:2673917-Pyramimonas_sp.AAC.1
MHAPVLPPPLHPHLAGPLPDLPTVPVRSPPPPLDDTAGAGVGQAPESTAKKAFGFNSTGFNWVVDCRH